MKSYLATAEVHIQLRGRIGSLEDTLRSAHLHDDVSVQDIDAVEWADPMNAHVRLALIVPVKDTELAGDELDHIIRTSLIGEEYTIAKGSMVITKVFEVIPFEEDY